MKSRVFHSPLSSGFIYSTLALASLTYVGEAQAVIEGNLLPYKEKWEITTSDYERISRQFSTRTGVDYILNHYSKVIYKVSRNSPVQEITVPDETGFKRTLRADKATLGYDDRLYLPNSTYAPYSQGAPEQMKSLEIFRLTPAGDQLELLHQSDCQNPELSDCQFTVPLLVSEKNSAIYSVRRDGNHSWLMQTALDGGNKSWPEIRFDTVVTGQIISADDHQLYLQSNSHFYIVDLDSGNITTQGELPPSLAENPPATPLSLRSDNGSTAFGATGNQLFRLNIFNGTSPFELAWVKEMAEIQDIALPPNRDVIYAWDAKGELRWVTKTEGNTSKKRDMNDNIRKMQFDPVSGWAYVMYRKLPGAQLTVSLLSPSGAIHDAIFRFSADYASLMDSDINLKNNILSIAVESKVYYFDLSGIMDYTDSGKNLTGYGLPGTTTRFSWEIGEDCSLWCPQETGTVTIDNANTTLLNQYHWPLLLAENVNKNSDLIRIGEMDEDGIIRPIASEYRNKIWILDFYKQYRYILANKVTPQPEIVSSWKLNPLQPGITAERNLAIGSKIELSVTLPNGSKRRLPDFTVSRSSKYFWPADLARFINRQASLLDLPIAAGERLSGDALTFPSSHYRNMLWVPANESYTLQYSIKP
ncbi:hypothetical protein [Pantoea phytobeneficialis]|uniref:N-acetylglucosamine binding protein A domain-containing protein n=1 Tax=Pantoea phytobeneficialis TaxID=2052056 RepID=A0AAP9HAC1_9GAMM|nr:hypothetical protein [Pantoea phytobeneficialis]MDO6407528.1 hypothetical protein [Pantoea phytobeneficialis]QGR09426.1 hypothetical protein CTZ24_23410 [Pantoea phytobeneficialis]